MYSHPEEVVLRLMSTGRKSLDHFVDSLQITCGEAIAVMDLLIEKEAVRRQGYFFTRALSYELTHSGSHHARKLLSNRSELAEKLNLLDEDLSVLRLIDDPWSLRSDVEMQASEIVDGGMQSVLVHLHELGLVHFKGTFVVKVGLTQQGQELRSVLQG